MFWMKYDFPLQPLNHFKVQSIKCLNVVVPITVALIFGSTLGTGNGLFMAKITSPQENETRKIIGTQLVLNCSVVSGGSSKFFLWKKDGKVIRQSKLGHELHWSVYSKLSLNWSDAGVYTCLAGNGIENKSDTVTVHVGRKPYFLYGDGKHTTTPQILSVNDEKTFYCRAKGRPKPHFRWLKNGVQVKPIRYIRELLEQKNGLDLWFPEGVIATDSGTYTCEASNTFGKAQYNISVYVEGSPPSTKPVLRADKPFVTSTDDSSNVTLVCFGEFTQEELTVAFWKFNNTVLKSDKPNPRVYYQNYYYDQKSAKRVKMSLIIQNVSLADTGNYTCVARTPSGGDQKSVYLTIKQSKKRYQPSRYKTYILVVIALCSAIGILVIVLLVIFYRRHKRRLHYTMLCEKYDVDGNKYKYDAFVTYSSHNCQWVQSNIVSFLEKNNFSCCIHWRNFEAGKCITENMAESVYSSRKVIAVLSKYYMESSFCREELNFALFRSLEKGHNCLIVIRIDDVSINTLQKSLRNKTLIDLQNTKEQSIWQKKLLDYVQVTSDSKDKELFQQNTSGLQDSNANDEKYF